MTAAAIYVRISNDPEGRRAGVKRQTTDCHKLAERRGWTVAEVYEDNDRSAWSGKARPAYDRMLADIAAKRIRAVVVWHLDRLHRSPRELEDFFETCAAAGLTKMATVTGDIDLGTRDGQLQARILGAVAKKSSDDTSARIRAAFDAKAARGEYKHGGMRPFGYIWDEDKRILVPHRQEAALIRQAAKRILAGDSRRKITQDWHAKGIRTSEGKPWSITRLGEVLASPRIVGKRVHRGEVVGPGNWKPILDEATQNRLIRRMKRQPVGKRAGRQRHLLTGLAFCGRCDSRLQAKARKDRKGNGFRTYRCSNDSAATCGSCSVLAEPIEQMVLWTAWTYFAPDPKEVFRDVHAAAGDDPRADKLRGTLADLDEREKQLTHDHYVDGLMSRAAFLESVTELRDDREAIEREIGRLEDKAESVTWNREQVRALRGPPPSLTGADPEDVEFWRSVVGAVYEKVVVEPWRGRRFSPERVKLVPRPQFKGAAVPYPSWDLPMEDNRKESA